MRRLRQMQTRGGYPGGRGGPQMPRGANGAVVGGILLAGGAWLLSNSLFNVDGGHRAIKYQRLRGVSKEIYSEGELRAGEREMEMGIELAQCSRICAEGG